MAQRVWNWAGLLAAVALAVPAAHAEPVLARCKVERMVDLSVSPQKSEKRSDVLRADPRFDWLFVFDTAGSRRLCNLGEELCSRRAEAITIDGDEVRASTLDWPDGPSGVLSINTRSGRWIFQQGLSQTVGGQGDCAFSAPTEHQVALLTLNPARDRDVLCAARLVVEAEILNSQGQAQPAQAVLGWAQTLLDRTVNRGYDRAARDAAVKAERAAYAARDDAGRKADFAPCQTRMEELQR